MNLTHSDLIRIAEKFDKWLTDIANEYHIDKDIIQGLIKQFLIG